MLLPETETEPVADVDLVRAAVEGEASAFAALFERHYPVIYQYAYRLCLRQPDAEDIAQDTFIKAARAMGDYRPEAPFANWLFRICTNTARDWQPKQSRRARIELSFLEFEPAVERYTCANRLRIEQALLGLEPAMREALVLVYYEGMNHAEAAQVLGCAETTVSWRIFRAKRQLKTILQRDE
jgi:RNA polymerase sigma-70 factor (ECF subfamily)